MADPVLQTREFVDADGVEVVYYYNIVDGHSGSHNVIVAADHVDAIEAISDSTEKLAAIDDYLKRSAADWKTRSKPALDTHEVPQPSEKNN